MSYEKQTWETGQVITADKLNHMEDGINSQPFIVLVGVYIFDPDEGIPSYHMLTPLADFEQAIADGKPILLNVIDEDSNNKTLKTYNYTGKIKWEGTTSYYMFTCSDVSKYSAQNNIIASIYYIRISMSGGIQTNSITLTM